MLDVPISDRIEIDYDFDSKEFNEKMKKYDPNNFIIDYVFGSIDKEIKKKQKKYKEAMKRDFNDEFVSETPAKETKDDMYVITINV